MLWLLQGSQGRGLQPTPQGGRSAFTALLQHEKKTPRSTQRMVAARSAACSSGILSMVSRSGKGGRSFRPQPERRKARGTSGGERLSQRRRGGQLARSLRQLPAVSEGPRDREAGHTRSRAGGASHRPVLSFVRRNVCGRCGRTRLAGRQTRGSLRGG